MNPQQPIFREVVTRRLAFPEELTEAVTIIRPYDWLIVGTLAAMLLAAILWSAIATVPITIHGEGILCGAGAADQPLQAVLFVQQNLANRIRPGQVVRLTSEMFPLGKRGSYLSGNVSQVSSHFVSDSGLRQVLDQEDLVRDFIFRGLRVRVDVSLDGYSDNHSDLEMSPSKDLGPTAHVGARVMGDILVARERPIVWLLRRARLSESE